MLSLGGAAGHFTAQVLADCQLPSASSSTPHAYFPSESVAPKRTCLLWSMGSIVPKQCYAPLEALDLPGERVV